MRPRTRLLVAAVLMGSLACHAAGGGGGGGGEDNATSADPVIAMAKAAIAKKDWAGAQAVLKPALAGNAANADYHNLYASPLYSCAPRCLGSMRSASL